MAPRTPGSPYAPLAERLAACVGDKRNLTAGLKPGKAASYLELRHVAGRDAPPEGSALFATGTPCVAAPDAAACSRSLRSPAFKHGFGPHCGPMYCSSFLLAEGADGVQVIGDPDALAAYLAPIDSADEASLVVYSVGYALPSCSEQPPKKVGKNWVVTVEHMTSDCPLTYADQTLSIAENGEVQVVGERNVRRTNACVGRRPPGFVPPATPQADAASPAAFLAECAALEAAAVSAFDTLGRELAALAAPAALRRGCREALADEVRHTRAMRRLAMRFAGDRGAQRANTATAARRRGEPRAHPNARRKAEELARENAVEGCVRETFGALVGLHQGAHAQDRTVRRAMRAVAADEVRHALLSWRIARWLEPRLSPAARRRVGAERLRAVAALKREIARPLARDLETVLGLPGPRAALAMLGALEESLWRRGAVASESRR